MIVRTKNGKSVADNNPFPTKLTTSDTVIPVDIQAIGLINSGESLPVTVVGGSVGGGTVTETDAVDIIDFVPSTQLRDSTAKTLNLPDLKKYKRYVIQVLNGLDQDIKVAPWNTAPVILEDGSVGYLATAATTDNSYSWTVPKKDANSSGLYFLNMIEPKSNGAGTLKVKEPARLFETMYSVTGTTMMFAYKAVAAPTSGSLTIRFIGFKR